MRKHIAMLTPLALRGYAADAATVAGAAGRGGDVVRTVAAKKVVKPRKGVGNFFC